VNDARSSGSPAPDDFYVGYLALPASDRRALRFLTPAILWLLVVVAGLAALAQRSPGNAVWDNGKPIVREGTLRAAPYPMLVLDDERSVLMLVEQGKHGAQGRSAPHDGRRVRVTGWRLARDGRSMLELVPDASAIEETSASNASGPLVPVRVARSVTLQGEIVDFKCYLGAMKPGDGKTHKACATLCIQSGIPPMLVTRGEDGAIEYLLLEDEDGGAAGDRVLEFVGEAIEARGELRTIGDLKVLRLVAGSLRRI
jgi:hypothetical protein